MAIPELYAAGNASGGFYGSTYPSVVSGFNKGWAITGGYLAGLNAAQGNWSDAAGAAIIKRRQSKARHPSK